MLLFIKESAVKKLLLGLATCVAIGFTNSMSGVSSVKELISNLDLSRQPTEELLCLEALNEEERSAFYQELFDAGYKSQMEKMFPSHPKEINDHLTSLYYNPFVKCYEKQVVLAGYTDQRNDCFVIKAYHAKSDNFDIIREISIKREMLTSMSGGEIFPDLTALALRSDGLVAVARQYIFDEELNKPEYTIELHSLQDNFVYRGSKAVIDKKVTAMTIVDNEIYFVTRQGEENTVYKMPIITENAQNLGCKAFRFGQKQLAFPPFRTKELVISLQNRGDVFHARTPKELWVYSLHEREWLYLNIKENPHVLVTCYGYSGLEEENHMLEAFTPVIKYHGKSAPDVNNVKWRIRDNNYYLTYSPLAVLVGLKIHSVWENSPVAMNTLALCDEEELGKQLTFINKDYLTIFDRIPHKDRDLISFIRYIRMSH